MKTIIAAAMALGHVHTFNPPPRFDHAYHGRLTVEEVKPADVPARCAALLASIGIRERPDHGCAVWHGRSCHIVIPTSSVQGASPAAIKRHEIGHCNGWNATHSN